MKARKGTDELANDENSSYHSREVFNKTNFKKNVCNGNEMENTRAQKEPNLSRFK